VETRPSQRLSRDSEVERICSVEEEYNVYCKEVYCDEVIKSKSFCKEKEFAGHVITVGFRPIETGR